MEASADVVYFADARRPKELIKGTNEVRAVNVVANLLSFVAENRIRHSGNRALHQVGQETVQLGPTVIGPR